MTTMMVKQSLGQTEIDTLVLKNLTLKAMARLLLNFIITIKTIQFHINLELVQFGQTELAVHNITMLTAKQLCMMQMMFVNWDMFFLAGQFKT